jgi:8-oxo-dGTP diphosphatase
MSTSKYREFACAILIDTLGRLLLQRRDDIPGILFPGRIGIFGGHREDNETFLQCVVREIHEEITYYVPPERFTHLASYEGVDPEVDNGNVRSEYFITRDIPVDDLVITEGALLIAKPNELDSIEPQFTPALRFAINTFLKSCPRSASRSRISHDVRALRMTTSRRSLRV